jgi:hypothetical protein
MQGVPTRVSYYGKEYSVRKTLNRITKFMNSPRGRGYHINNTKFKAEIEKNPKFVIRAAKFMGVEPVLAK